MSERVTQEATQRKTAGMGKGGLATFLRAAFFDFIGVWLLATALVATVSYFFESGEYIRGNILFDALAIAPMLVVLFAGSWSKRAMIGAAIVAVILGCVMIGAGQALSSPDAPLFVDGALADSPDNYVLFSMILVVMPVLVFLLSRRMVGIVVLFALTIASCAFVQFFYREWMTDLGGGLLAVLALLGIGIIFVYQTYRSSLLDAARAKKSTFAGAFIFSTILAGICVALSMGLFTLLIEPLQLSTPDLKPFQETFAQPEEEYSGVYADEEIESDENMSDDTEDEDDTNQDEDNNKDDKNEHQSSPLSGLQDLMEMFNPNNLSQQFDPKTFEIIKKTALFALLVIALVAAAGILLRRWWRKHRLDMWGKEPRTEQVDGIYRFLLKRFKRLGLGKEETLTPMEYALMSENAMDEFSDNGRKVSFVRVTDIYQSACYGAREVDDADYQDIVSFYEGFFNNARKHVGNFKWIWKFWRI